MKRMPSPRRALAAALVCAGLLPGAGCRSKAPSDVVATWDGGSLTRGEVERYVRFLETRRLRTGAKMDARSGMAEILADLAYLEITAAEAGDADPGSSVLYLDPRGAMLVRYYAGTKGKRSHQVTEEEARAFYEKRLSDRFTLPESCTFRHVFLRADRRSKEELGSLERKVLAALDAGTPFPELVSTYSESETARRGGVVGPVFRGRMDPAFEEALYRLAPNRPGVIRMPQGTHVVEVTEKRPPRVLPFEEVQGQIASAIMDQRNEKEREELETSLRARHGVLDRTEDPTAGPDDVVLRVKDRELTRRQLDAYIERRTARAWSRGKDTGLRRRWVDDLVRSNLLYLDAVESGMDKEQAFLDRWELQRTRLRSGAMVEKRLEAAVREVPDEEVLRYFRENRGRFALPRRSEASFVFMPFGAAPPFELEQRIEALERFALQPGVDLEEVGRRCDEAGAIFVDMGWTTSREAALIAPEFQRRFLAQKEPGSTGVFKVEEGLFVILVRAVEEARQMTEPADGEEIRAHYAVLRRKELLESMKKRELERRHFQVLSTDVFKPADEKG